MDRAIASEQDKYNLNAAEVILAKLGVYTAMPMQQIKAERMKTTPIGVALKAHFDAKNFTQSRLDAHNAYHARADNRKAMREAASQLENL